MLPRVAIDGRLAADPTLRFTQGGKAVASLRLVASDRRKNEQTGAWEDSRTLWIDATCFDKLAENVVESVQKGDLVVVTGRLVTEEWEDRNTGDKRSKIAMVADTVGASLQFRILPHAGATHAQRAPNPVNQAYGAGSPGADAEPPFLWHEPNPAF